MKVPEEETCRTQFLSRKRVGDLEKGGEIRGDDRIRKVDSSFTVASGKEERVGPRH